MPRYLYHHVTFTFLPTLVVYAHCFVAATHFTRTALVLHLPVYPATLHTHLRILGFPLRPGYHTPAPCPHTGPARTRSWFTHAPTHRVGWLVVHFSYPCRYLYVGLRYVTHAVCYADWIAVTTPHTTRLHVTLQLPVYVAAVTFYLWDAITLVCHTHTFVRLFTVARLRCRTVPRSCTRCYVVRTRDCTDPTLPPTHTYALRSPLDYTVATLPLPRCGGCCAVVVPDCTLPEPGSLRFAFTRLLPHTAFGCRTCSLAARYTLPLPVTFTVAVNVACWVRARTRDTHCTLHRAHAYVGSAVVRTAPVAVRCLHALVARRLTYAVTVYAHLTHLLPTPTRTAGCHWFWVGSTRFTFTRLP